MTSHANHLFLLHLQNGYKENIPPKGGQTEEGGGLLGGLGQYEDKRRRLQEERKKEYNQLLAEVGVFE